FAAESHVDRSIQSAKSFVTTNVLGTFTLLNAAKDAWQNQGTLFENRFHQISTDEVYGALGEKGQFTEETPYDPRNPYSASKAGANMLVKSFGYTHGMNIIISSSSNNYGPMQHHEKLIPMIISNAVACSAIPLCGDGQDVRYWLYVNDDCSALDNIYHHGKTLNTYNVGGSNEKANIDLAVAICEILDQLRPTVRKNANLSSFKELITFTEDRLGHDPRYAIDDKKLRQEMGWKPKIHLDTSLKATIEWYVEKWDRITR